jgi:enoyl-CoA hydratase/carnithine racemase
VNLEMGEPPMSEPSIILTQDAGRVRTITLNRPDKLNAFNRDLFEALQQALNAAAEDDGVHVVVLTGAGRAFSAGADLSDMAAPKRDAGGQASQGEDPFDRLQAIAEAFPKPLVGAVNGLGVGIGFTILGYFDFCFVGESAKLRTPFSQLGLSPEASASYLFPLRMGWAAASRALMLGDWFNARDAVDCGIAQEVVPDERLMETTLAFAARLAECPLQSLKATKALMLEAHLPHVRAIRARERQSLRALVGTEANKEALRAFAARSGRG